MQTIVRHIDRVEFIPDLEAIFGGVIYVMSGKIVAGYSQYLRRVRRCKIIGNIFIEIPLPFLVARIEDCILCIEDE